MPRERKRRAQVTRASYDEIVARLRAEKLPPRINDAETDLLAVELIREVRHGLTSYRVSQLAGITMSQMKTIVYDWAIRCAILPEKEGKKDDEHSA